MRWWLRRFNDVELAAIATDLLGVVVKPEGMRREREVLIASASKKPDVTE